jgi:hypothetical protein
LLFSGSVCFVFDVFGATLGLFCFSLVLFSLFQALFSAYCTQALALRPWPWISTALTLTLTT